MEGKPSARPRPLHELPLETLLDSLCRTVYLVGPDSGSVRAMKRAIVRKFEERPAPAEVPKKGK